MVLKLKDWPPGEDFRDMMPSRYEFTKKLFIYVVYPQNNRMQKYCYVLMPASALKSSWSRVSRFVSQGCLAQLEMLNKFHDC